VKFLSWIQGKSSKSQWDETPTRESHGGNQRFETTLALRCEPTVRQNRLIIGVRNNTSEILFSYKLDNICIIRYVFDAINIYHFKT
jgi:hypothetical protein